MDVEVCQCRWFETNSTIGDDGRKGFPSPAIRLEPHSLNRRRLREELKQFHLGDQFLTPVSSLFLREHPSRYLLEQALYFYR